VVILGCWLICTRLSVWLLPLCVILLASRQRALGVILHDAAHGNVYARDGLSQWLLAAPMFEELSLYRRLHLSHHGHLGRPGLDPDYLEPDWSCRSAWVRYRRWLLDRTMWRRSLLGELVGMSGWGRLQVALWWGAFLGGFTWLAGAESAASFALLWLLSRATAYHALKVFTELTDHVGLRPGTVLSYTRNSPSNLLSLLLHPHDDGYHLTHHLAPRVPLLALARAHRLLLGMELYRRAHQCDAYFRGSRSVVASWVSGGQLEDDPLPGTP
jgi:fatty acid desaturase